MDRGQRRRHRLQLHGHPPGPRPFNDEAPYGLVMAKLVEEPRACIVLGNTRDIPNEDLRVGLPLRIVYEDIPAEDVTMWRFGPR